MPCPTVTVVDTIGAEPTCCACNSRLPVTAGVQFRVAVVPTGVTGLPGSSAPFSANNTGWVRLSTCTTILYEQVVPTPEAAPSTRMLRAVACAEGASEYRGSGDNRDGGEQ